MRKLRLVARHEYLNTIRRRSFLLATLGIPLLIVAVTGISILVAMGTQDDRPLGYVDRAGVLPPQPLLPAGGEPVQVVGFADKAAAQAALAAGTIQAYYVLPVDYLQSHQVALYYWEKAPSEQTKRAFDAFLRLNLLADRPASIQRRISDGLNLTARSADGTREFSEATFLNLLLPFIAGLLFVFSTMSSIGYLIQAITVEKENRTIEVMATSVTPVELIGGKAIGLMGVGLTQLSIWVPVAGLGLVLGVRFIGSVAGLQIPWHFLLVMAAYFVPAYALIASMMIAVGGIVSEMSQAQQIGGLLNLLFFVPYFFFAAAFADPNSPWLVFLTLFPTTSFITVTIRWGLTAIPAWQLGISWLLLTGSAVFGVWAAARIFRAGMLRYGQPLRLPAIMAALRGDGH